MSALGWIGIGVALVFAWLSGRDRERRITIELLQQMSASNADASTSLMRRGFSANDPERCMHRGAANALMDASAKLLIKSWWKP